MKTDNKMSTSAVLEHRSHTEGEITLSQIVGIIKLYKKVIISIALIIFLSTILLSLLMPNYYKSEVLLAPSDAFSNNADQYGKVASLVGLDLSKGMNNVNEAIAILQSKKFINDFVNVNNLKHVLFYDKWDIENQIWFNSDQGLLSNVKKIFTGKTQKVSYKGMEKLAPGEPSAWDTYILFKDILDISEDLSTGMYRLEVEWTDPVVAQEIASKLVASINKKMRIEDIEQAQDTIHFLEKQLVKTSISDIRQSVYNLIEKSMESIAMANVQKAYVFKILDPAIVPEEKSKPKRFLMAILGLIFGSILGFFVALILNWGKSNSEA